MPHFLTETTPSKWYVYLADKTWQGGQFGLVWITKAMLYAGQGVTAGKGPYGPGSSRQTKTKVDKWANWTNNGEPWWENSNNGSLFLGIWPPFSLYSILGLLTFCEIWKLTISSSHAGVISRFVGVKMRGDDMELASRRFGIRNDRKRGRLRFIQ